MVGRWLVALGVLVVLGGSAEAADPGGDQSGYTRIADGALRLALFDGEAAGGGGTGGCIPCPSPPCVQGKVTDQAEGPLEGAKVRLVPTQGQEGENSWLTDENGEFLFLEVPEGKYTVVVEAVGFDSVRTQAFSVEAAQSLVFRPLELPVGSGDAVLVSVSPEPCPDSPGN